MGHSSARWDGSEVWLLLSNHLLIGHGIFRKLKVVWVSFAVIGCLVIRGPSFPLRGHGCAPLLENIPNFPALRLTRSMLLQVLSSSCG